MSRAAAAAAGVALRLLPAERRDWVRAIWAESYEVPSGRRRLAWLAGGLPAIATGALMASRIGRWLVFAVAAGCTARVTWPGSPDRFATVIARMDLITVVLLLAGLPWLMSRFLGSASDSRLGRFLRVGGYGAVLTYTVAKARLVPAGPDPTGPALQFAWFAEILLLVVVAGYVAAILAVTARRSRVAPATLAIGTGAGVVLGVVMYAVAPLGLSKVATDPWLPGSEIDPVVALAWILLLGGPMAAAVLAGRRYLGPGDPHEIDKARIWQCAVAGILATGVGALIVAILGTGTIALMPRAAWLRHWLYPGQHLLAGAVHSRELAASNGSGAYGLILIAFPVIGLLLGVFSSAAAIESSGPPAGGGGPPRPEPGPEPVPDSPGSGRLADAGAGKGGSTAGLPGWGEEGPDGVQGEVMAGLTGGAGLGAGAR
jgi:hypothetical protein